MNVCFCCSPIGPLQYTIRRTDLEALLERPTLRPLERQSAADCYVTGPSIDVAVIVDIPLHRRQILVVWLVADL